MVIKYNAEIQKEAIIENVNRITNRIYKLLPYREEGDNWESPLQSLKIEIIGMASLLNDHVDLFPVLCKLEALSSLKEEEDFLAFRKTVFEILTLMNKVKDSLCQQV